MKYLLNNVYVIAITGFIVTTWQVLITNYFEFCMEYKRQLDSFPNKLSPKMIPVLVKKFQGIQD